MEIRGPKCKCSGCRRQEMFNNLAYYLGELGANEAQFEKIKESINKILDGRQDGSGNKD